MNETIINSYRVAAELIKKYRNDRKIVFYGENDEFRELIKNEFGIETELSLTTVEKKAGSGRIFIDSIKGKAKEYYIIIPHLRAAAALKKLFKGLGFREFKDFLFVNRSNTVLAPGAPDYKDEYGNFIHSGGCQVVLGKYVCNSTVIIDDSFKGEMRVRLFGSGGAKVNIGKKCKTGGTSRIFVHDNGVLSIGNGVSFGDNTKISIMENNSITIGDDCMFSYDILLFSGDGHAIFDMETGKRTNFYLDDDPKGTITLGKHVWVGAGSFILNRAEIGDSCIIGAGSTFKGVLPEYCIAAGNPARIVKRNVTWSRNANAKDISECFKTWQFSDDEEELEDDDE